MHTCTACTLTELPFHNTRNLNETLDNETQINPPSRDFHIDKLQANQNNTSIAHLNVQALMSTFNEFSIMLNSYQFDIIVVTETWLQDTEYQRDYVQVNGYNTVFKNRTGKRGGGVGFYLKEQLQYKVRTGLTRNYTDLEILVVEIRGRNKNTPSLVCAVYQPSSIEVEKREWLKKFEESLANLYTTWKEVLIITGDLNESTNRYKNILHTFSLQQRH